MHILFSDNRAAEQNLALEQQLLRGTEDVVLLYINSPSVVVGRNQTIEAEVDMEYCQAHNIAVVRRKSGGGAVYHDEGNLNYAIICNGGERPLDRDYTAPVVGGAKVSGSACMVHRGRVLFHGTLLFDADLTALEAALRGDESRRGRGIKSVRNTVANLKPMLSDVADIEGFMERLCSAMQEFFCTDLL